MSNNGFSDDSRSYWRRRDVLRAAAALPAASSWLAAANELPAPKSVAAIVTAYYRNSHADVIVSRLLQGYSLLDDGERPNLRLASLYVDQLHKADSSRDLGKKYNVPIYDSIPAALQCGGDKLAVDGVLLVAEHGTYPTSAIGSTVYPKRRFFEELLRAYDASDRVAPVFVDKHLADNWPDAKWLYDAARQRGIELMAGSSLPQTWRRPPVDPPRNSAVREIMVLSYHTLDAYGFHAIEAMQAIAERRDGGETGVRAVECLTGPAAWKAADARRFDPRLFEAAFARLAHPTADLAAIRERVPEPTLFRIEYADGLLAHVFTLNGAVGEWTAAWRYADDRIESTLFWVQEERPLGHFTHLLRGLEHMFHTGKGAWPVERTLLSSGLLAFLLESKARGGVRRETPELALKYACDWDWRDPPAAPPGRPLDRQ